MISLIFSQKKFITAECGEWWHAKIPHELGLLDVVGVNDSLFGVGFERQATPIQHILEKQKIIFSHKNMTFDQLMAFKKIMIVATPFQGDVWQALLEIPWNTSQTYSEIALRINRPKALRAVGTAIGANPVSILIPCHRVLPKSGGIGNYYWGATRKAALLAFEQSSSFI